MHFSPDKRLYSTIWIYRDIQNVVPIRGQQVVFSLNENRTV